MLKKVNGMKATVYDTGIEFVDEIEEDIVSTYYVYLFEDDEDYTFWLGIDPRMGWHMSEMFTLPKSAHTKKEALAIAEGNLWNFTDSYKRELREVAMVQELNMMWDDRKNGSFWKRHKDDECYTF